MVKKYITTNKECNEAFAFFCLFLYLENIGSEDFRGVEPRGFPIRNLASHVIPTTAVYFIDGTFSNDEKSQMTYQTHTSGPVLTQIKKLEIYSMLYQGSLVIHEYLF